MNSIERVKDYIKSNKMLSRMIFMLLSLTILFLIKMTWTIWTTAANYAYTSLKPFLIGFLIAYILNPLVNFLERKGIKKGIAISLVLLLIVGGFILIFINLIPNLSSEIVSFVNSIGSSIDIIVDWYEKTSKDPSGLIGSIIQQLSVSFSGIENGIIDFVRVSITQFVGASMSFFTTSLFSITISIYMLSDFQKFKDNFKAVSKKINWKFPYYLEAVDIEMGVYVRSTLMLMLVYFIEYTAIYFVMGHNSYLMIGLLYVIIGTLVPYVGGIIVTVIGVLTGLAMPTMNLIILMVLVMILSQVDGYVTSPLIYKKGIKIEPLMSLFVIFIGSAVFGFMGVIFAVPVYVVFRAVNTVNKKIKMMGKEAFISEETN